MRVLFLSNYFPPQVGGGYEMHCHEVAAELVLRGHQVCALTSELRESDRASINDRGVRVMRVLHLEVEAGLVRTAARLVATRRRLEQENLERVRDAVARFCPDVAMIWGMWNVPRSVPGLVEDLLGTRVAYYLCDYWPSLPSAYIQQWQTPARRALGDVPKQLLSRPLLAWLTRHAPIELRLEHPICISSAVRDLLVEAGIAVGHADVIYGGIQPHEFGPPNRATRSPSDARSLRMVSACRLSADKGVHTAIRGLARLTQSTDRPVTLDIVGTGNPRYERELKQLVSTCGLHDRVHFRGSVPRSDMPRLLGQYDVLIHASEWPEPFPRIVLEAMAANLVVIGTTTGGTGDALVEDETGLTFAPGDAHALARQMGRLLDNPAMRPRLTTAARKCIEERFTLTHMVDQIEAALLHLVDAAEGPEQAA